MQKEHPSHLSVGVFLFPDRPTRCPTILGMTNTPESIDLPADTLIVLPTVECRIIYGLDEHGTPVVYQRWQDETGDDVDVLTKSGLLTFALQANTVDHFCNEGDDDE